MDAKITTYNYEAFALDYLEGQLSTAQKIQFEVFLGNHPNIKAEIEDFYMVTLSSEDAVIYPHKKKLFRSVSFTPFSYNRVAFVIILVMISIGIWHSQNETSQTSAIEFIASTSDSKPSSRNELITISEDQNEAKRPSIYALSNTKSKKPTSSNSSLKKTTFAAASTHEKESTDSYKRSYSSPPSKKSNQKSKSISQLLKPVKRYVLDQKVSTTLAQKSTPISRLKILRINPLDRADIVIHQRVEKPKMPIDIAMITDIGDNDNGYFGKWAFAKTKISIVPSYFNAD